MCVCVCVWLTEAQPTLHCVWLRMNENHFTPPAQYNPFSSDWLMESYRSVCFLSATPSPDTAAAQRSIRLEYVTPVFLCAHEIPRHMESVHAKLSRKVHRFTQNWKSHHSQTVMHPTEHFIYVCEMILLSATYKTALLSAQFNAFYHV